ncbi:MAG: hypothetical protein R3B90_10560 [Planctomycetaceae bacterium]
MISALVLVASLLAGLLASGSAVAIAEEGGDDADAPAAQSGDAESEAELRADAERTFKKQVEPFVNKYCISCHGSRPEAGINLQSALRLRGPRLRFAVAEGGRECQVARHAAHAGKIPTDDERGSSSGSASSSTWPAGSGPFVIRRLSKAGTNTLHEGVRRGPVDRGRPARRGRWRGYLNSISPLQSELFLDIANKVIEQVVAEGQPATDVQASARESPSDESQYRGRRRCPILARYAYRRPPTEANWIIWLMSLTLVASTT